jgi:hypothetical protein
VSVSLHFEWIAGQPGGGFCHTIATMAADAFIERILACRNIIDTISSASG